MKILKPMAVAIGILALAACQTASNPTAWGQIATGAGAIIGKTPIDPQIEKVSAKLARYCVDVQTAAVAVEMFAAAKVQRAAINARGVVSAFCASPPTSVSTAITSLAAAYAAIEAARRAS